MQRFIPGLRTRVVLSLLAAVLGLSIAPQVIDPPTAHAQTTQATIGSPFGGTWAWNANVNPPYNDSNSSHPSVHAPYGFNWATDVYADGGTEVKVYGSSSQGTVTFKRVSNTDTCASAGAGKAGWGVTFSVLVNGTKVGEVKYDHLDLTDVGSNPIASGTPIGVVTKEALVTAPSNCYTVKHAHVQFRNTTGNVSCYTDHGNPGAGIAAGQSLGVLGSTNTTRSACKSATATPAGGSPFGPLDELKRVPGGIRGTGWAIDPDTASPIEVHLYSGNGDADYRNPGFATVANINRPDVGAANPGYGNNHGFSAVVAAKDPGNQTVCAYGINVGAGSNVKLGCKVIHVSYDPYGSLDTVERVAGGVIVSGWSIDPDTRDPNQVHIYGGDGAAQQYNAAVATVANVDRGDIAAVFPEYGGLHGFRVFLATGPGPQTFCAYGINTGPGISPRLNCRNG